MQKEAMPAGRQVYEFISKQTQDPIVEWKTCAVSGKPFAIFQSDVEFYEKISPTFNGKKFAIPTPTLCPEERQRRRLAWRNERKLYKRKCDLTGKTIISMYHEGAPYIIYGHEARRSDQWDALNYGQDIDDNKTFLEQFESLQKKVPLLAQAVVAPENSDYTNFGYHNKDCYLTYASDLNEKCLQSTLLRESTYCVDCLNVRTSQRCYELIDSVGCYQCSYAQALDTCSQCNRCYHCINCQNCTGCINQVGRTYMWFDEQLTKEQYNQKVKETDINACKKLFNQRMSQAVRNQSMNHNCELCFGDGIVNAKRCILCFDVSEITDCKYINNGPKNVTSCMDIDGAGMLSLGYDSMSLGGESSYKSAFCINVRDGSTNCYYCQLCVGCNFCFGCIGLRNKSYCIFNKQYTKEGYDIAVHKLVTHMQQTPAKDPAGNDGAGGTGSQRGEFLDPSVSSFGYNETLAQELFPLDKATALARGYKWSDYEYHIDISASLAQIDAKDLPTDPDNTLLENAIIDSEHNNLPWRFVQQEFDFYRRLGIPLPHTHPDIRHAERRAKRSGKELHLRQCDKCNIEMLSVYPGDFEGKVYCEGCYTKAVYG